MQAGRAQAAQASYASECFFPACCGRSFVVYAAGRQFMGKLSHRVLFSTKQPGTPVRAGTRGKERRKGTFFDWVAELSSPLPGCFGALVD